MRTINKTLLRSLIRSRKHAKKLAAKHAGCSIAAIDRYLNERNNGEPREYYCLGISDYFQVSVDELFPLVAAKGKKQAS